MVDRKEILEETPRFFLLFSFEASFLSACIGDHFVNIRFFFSAIYNLKFICYLSMMTL